MGLSSSYKIMIIKDVMNTRGGGDNGKLESKMAVFKWCKYTIFIHKILKKIKKVKIYNFESLSDFIWFLEIWNKKMTCEMSLIFFQRKK